MPVSEEDLVAQNPSVIFSNVNYIDDPIAEITARPALQNVSAVQQNQVFTINNLTSSLPNEYIVDAIKEMAKHLHPDVFSNL